MPSRRDTERQTPRVILEQPIPARIAEMRCLVLELGLGGAKLEHEKRLEVGERCLFEMESIATDTVVRHSVLLPAQSGTVYHTGISFDTLTENERQRVFARIIREAEVQVSSWESNLSGGRSAPRRLSTRSAAIQQFLRIRLTPSGWDEGVTPDPNQPIDGIAIPADTPKNEIQMLKKTYAAADERTRLALRNMAMLAILERLEK
ncbi:MAG: hypothetical protein WBX15_13045 [Thermoanaerobaculia bacterium]